MTGLGLSFDDAHGVWCELELALAGKNGYGGDVAEIYAYRLVPGGASAIANASKTEEQARLAGKNMTILLRGFADLHEGVVISIQESRGDFRRLDLAQDFPPFDWRVHLRVSQPRPPADAPSTRKVREAIDEVAKHHNVLVEMLDELLVLRAKARLYADIAELMKPTSTYDDLPPDGATGLYLDRPFDAEDLE